MIAIGFAFGSVPFGLILGRARGVDIRQHGSKNIGATNVGRVLGRPLGFLCFALDALKGALPVLSVWFFIVPLHLDNPSMVGVLMPLVGIAAILGHVYSPWVGFRGGKGVATSFGALLAMWPLMTFPALGALVVWIALVKLTRLVSLASICAALSLPFFLAIRAFGWNDGNSYPIMSVLPLMFAVTALALLVVFKHRANIARLRAGTEPRVGGAKPIAASNS